MGNYDVLRPLESKVKETQSGITFHSETYFVGNDRFTNLYWVELNKDSSRFKLLFSDKTSPLMDFQYPGHTLLAGLNFGGFYLSDDGYTYHIPYYNLAVREGMIKQLPCNLRCALLTNSGKLDKRLLLATGKVQIGKEKCTWRGTNMNNDTDLIAYGMFNIDISKNPDKSFGRAREIKNLTRFVTASKHEILLGITVDDNAAMVREISNTDLDLLKFNIVFKGKSDCINKIREGDLVTLTDISGETFGITTDVCSGSFSLGRDKEELESNMKAELIHPSNGLPKPMDENYRKSWSVVLETDKSYVFFINDARPKIENQNGLTVYELQDLLMNRFNYKWGVVGDSGQSTKLMVLENGKRNVYGNMHYINYTKDKPYWDGENGRPVSVGLFAYA